ncbi:hypothetical protein D3C84_750960 [compost metagenome]
MTIDVYRGNCLVALLDQTDLLQIVQLVANGTLGQAGVLSQGRGRWKRASAIGTGVVGQAQQHMPCAGVFQ